MTQAAIVDAVKANESKKITQAANAMISVSQVGQAVQEATTAVQEVGDLLTGSPLDKGLTLAEIQTALSRVHGETAEGKNDGTRVHLHYTAFGKPTPTAIQNATRAAELGLPRDRYTGRISKVWKSRESDQCITMMVELERDHMFRTFNLDKGKVYRFIVLGA
jgi:hypothetical protein